MLRITNMAEGEAGTTLKLEGKLVGPWIEELHESWRRAVACGPVKLDLGSVHYVEARGVELLRQLVREGVTVLACSALVSELLQGEGK